MLKPKLGDTLQTIAEKSYILPEVLSVINNKKLDEHLDTSKDILVLDLIPDNIEGVRDLTVGDLMENDFDSLLQKIDPPIFLVQYYTVKGIALGKMTLTNYEIIFEPLNPKLKGFINQESNLKSRRLFQ